MDKPKEGSGKRIYKFRLSDPDSHPDSLWMTKWRELGVGYLSTNSTHGLNPHISNAVGACKLILWICLFLGGLAGLGVHFYAMTSSFLAYDVLVKTTLSQVTDIDFPAVTICNMNPIKNSLLSNNPRLSALVESWRSDDDRRRRRREAGAVNQMRTRRSVSLPNVVECPSNVLLHFGEYCYTIETSDLDWTSAQAQCEVGGGNLVWFDSEQEHDVITQLYCQTESCSGVMEFWTGLYDATGNNDVADYVFTWGGSPSYSAWSGGEPSRTSHTCVEDRRTQSTFIWEWNDNDCSQQNDYVCKYRFAEQTNETSIQYNITACEGETANLTCQGTATIHILSVFYGRSDQSTCNPSGDTTSAYDDCECETNDGCSISVLQACENVASCEAYPTDDFIGIDPCESISKYLSISYRCLTLDASLSQETTTESTTEEPTTVHQTTNQDATTARQTTNQDATTAHQTTNQDATTAHQTTNQDTPTVHQTTNQDITTVLQTTNQETTVTSNQPTSTPGVIPTSAYEERDPYREDFLQESEFLMVLAELSEEEKQDMGYNLTDIVTDCSFQGESCNMGEFSQFFDGTHGNCYVFNSGWDMGGIFKTSQTGRSNGLRLVLKLGQEEYLPGIGEAAGAVVVVHPQNRFPFPEDEGILALPGHINSIGTREIKVTRLGGLYGNCTNSETKQSDINVFEEWYPETSYSTTACYKTCYQRYVIRRCGCADPAYPMTGKALGVKNTTACDARDVTQDDCVYGVTLDYIAGKLDCTCYNPCREKWYKYFPSKTTWPSEMGTDTFLTNFADDILSYENFTDDPEFFRRNFLMIEVYFESLQLKQLEEIPKYKIEQYAAGIGGTIGLWVGLTLLSIAEFFELFVDVVVLMCTKIVHRNRLKEKTEVTELQAMDNNREDSFVSISSSTSSNTNLIRRHSKSDPSSHKRDKTGKSIMDVNLVNWD